MVRWETRFQTENPVWTRSGPIRRSGKTPSHLSIFDRPHLFQPRCIDFLEVGRGNALEVHGRVLPGVHPKDLERGREALPGVHESLTTLPRGASPSGPPQERGAVP